VTDDLLERCREALAFPDAACLKLYEQAKHNRWRIDQDIDWRELDLRVIAPSIRRAMATVYAQIRYAEMFGLVHVAKTLAQTDAAWTRLLIAAQVADESQHVEFFSRVMALLGMDAEPSPSLVAFGEELDRAASIEEAFLGGQLLLESFAQTIFHDTASLSKRARENAIRFPGSLPASRLVECVTNFVARDEARHVAFGVLFLRRRWPELSAAERERMQQSATRWSAMLDAILADIAPELARLGLSCTQLTEHVEQTRRRHLRQIMDP
jgi:hypothetical protein